MENVTCRRGDGGREGGKEGLGGREGRRDARRERGGVYQGQREEVPQWGERTLMANRTPKDSQPTTTINFMR